MRLQRSRRSVLVVARVTVCVVALLIQATLLPLAHAYHIGTWDGCVPFGARLAPAAVADHVGRAGAAQPAHDAAACPLCATLAHGRTSIVPVAITAPGLDATLETPPRAVAVWFDLTVPSAGRPRAPPALTA